MEGKLLMAAFSVSIGTWPVKVTRSCDQLGSGCPSGPGDCKPDTPAATPDHPPVSLPLGPPSGFCLLVEVHFTMRDAVTGSSDRDQRSGWQGPLLRGTSVVVDRGQWWEGPMLTGTSDSDKNQWSGWRNQCSSWQEPVKWWQGPTSEV